MLIAFSVIPKRSSKSFFVRKPAVVGSVLMFNGRKKGRPPQPTFIISSASAVSGVCLQLSRPSVVGLYALFSEHTFCLVLFCLGMFSVAWGARGSPSVVVTAGVLPAFMFVLVMPCYVVWCGKYHVCFCPCLLRVRSLASEMRGSP